MKITKRTYHKNRVSQSTFTPEELLECLTNEKTRTQVEDFRRRWKRTLPSGRVALMRRLPQLLFGGTFRKSGMRQYNGWIGLEINNLKSEQEAEELKQSISAYPQVLFALTAATGNGVAFVVPYTRPDGSLPQTTEEATLFHAHAYRHALKTFEPRIAYPIDLREPSPEQGCLLTYDPAAYYNPAALPIHLEQPTAMPAETFHQEHYAKLEPSESFGKTFYERRRYISIQFELAMRKALEHHATLDTQFDFKPMLAVLIKHCFGAGIEEEECVKWTSLYLGNLLTETEIRETVSNIYSIETGFGDAPVCRPEQLQALMMEEFMNRRYEFRFNTMAGSPEYRERNSFCFDYRPLTDRVLNSIALNAGKEGLKVWDRDVRRFIYSDRLVDYAPIEDYLRTLPQWDGRDRIRPLARRIPCDNPRWDELFYKWFLSMVAHWQGRDSKHGNSVSPLLVGGQGCGKSTFCLSLLPPELKTYYTDSIDFSKKRDAELYLTRFALINIDEFDQVSERHQGFLKHLLQKPVVNVRKPYASQVEAVKRYASFIATSNHTDLLNDISGSRRFICIEVKGLIDNTQPIEYEQVYAQALTALDRNERYWLTHDEEVQLMGENEDFRRRPIYEDLFHKYFRPAASEEEGVKMSAGELYLAIQRKSGVKLGAGQLSYFGRFLKKVLGVCARSNRGMLYRVVEK